MDLIFITKAGVVVNVELSGGVFASKPRSPSHLTWTEMFYYLTAAGIIAHTYFWGGGLAWLVLPRIWRRWVWVFAPGFGFALQSAVIWGGVHTALVGTDSYAWWSELVPSALLALAFSRRTGGISRKYVGLLIIALLAGWRLLSPMTELGNGLTTSSLGNCDQADYAAGARVFQQFSRDDRSGFLGLSEVTKVRSSDYFFDFWVRLNHFTPSAVIAHNASLFGVPAFRLVSVMAVAVALLNLPVCLFLARLTVGLRGGWLLGFVALYAASPLNAYAVYHGQLGQLYATQGIATTGAAIQARLRLVVQSFLPSDLTIKVGGQTPVPWRLNGSNQTLEYDHFILSPGSTTISLVSNATSPGGRDDRRLAFALYDLEVQTQVVGK